MTVVLIVVVVWALTNVAMVGVFVLIRRLERRHRHVWALTLTPTRISLTCVVCDIESPGWALFETPSGCQRYAEVPR